MITLRQLKYLSSLAKHGHFGRAAQDCAVTQPAMSMQIRDLEKELGLALVERRPGDVTLTEAGLEIVRRADEVLAKSRDLVDFARHRSHPLTGRLTLGLIPSLAPYALPKILPKLQAKFPELQLELRETQTRQLLEEVRGGALDTAMVALPVHESDIETLHLFDDRFLLAVPADDLRMEASRVAADDIDQDRLILLEDGHCLRDQALAFCATAARGRTNSSANGGRMTFGASSLATVIQMVANGFGITLIPQIAADVERRDSRVKFLRFKEPQPMRSIGLVFRRTSPRRRDFSALGDIVSECLGLEGRRPETTAKIKKGG